MAEWRIGRGWTEAELEERLERLEGTSRNFDDPVDELTRERGWRHYHSEAVIGHDSAGSTLGEAFERGQDAIATYAFSDPRIVIGHFNPDVPLLGRHMLLEMRALRVLHYLGGVVIGATRHDEDDERTVFGFRYDTLEGHIERGMEWFTLTKIHATGELRFRIEAAWKPGQFPNWWSRVGFSVLGHHYQREWHQLAHRRMAELVRDPDFNLARIPRRRLAHTGPEITFSRS